MYFFTNRVELGDLNVHKELDFVSNLHGSVTEQQLSKIFEEMKRAEGEATGQPTQKKGLAEDYEAIKIRVKVKAMDYLGRESTRTTEMKFSDQDEPEERDQKSEAKKEDILEITAAYLRAINVPCMYDLGTPTIDPYDHQLLLNIMDDLTYYKSVKPDFIDKKGVREKYKIEKF